MSETIVAVRGLSKRFGATRALTEVDLDVRAGSVVALLGQNGAGKSTLIKILAGVQAADSGTVTVSGIPLGSSGAGAQMAFLHQDLGLVDGLSVAENIALGPGYPRRGPLIGWRAVRRNAQRALDIVGSALDPGTRVAELSRTERSMTALARALVVDDVRVLVLDEPTASLPIAETERLFAILRTLRDRGLGLLYVSHRLDEVFAIADEMTVLRDGEVVRRGRIADTDPGEVVRAIVGRRPVPSPPPAVPAAGRVGAAVRPLPGGSAHGSADRSGGPSRALDAAPALEVDGLVGERFGPLSLALRHGEVLALVGLAGAGHVELGRTLFGALPVAAGTISIDGSPFSPRGTADAVRRGLGFVTSNRVDEGLGTELTVAENLLPNPALQGQRLWTVRRHGVENRFADALVRRFDIRPPDARLPVSALSGGNQQKVLLARWLSIGARVLILEEPTAGVDVGAKSELYALLDEALAGGLAAVLICTDFEEVAAVSHRAMVVRDGLVVAAIDRPQLSVAALVGAASGAAA